MSIGALTSSAEFISERCGLVSSNPTPHLQRSFPLTVYRLFPLELRNQPLTEPRTLPDVPLVQRGLRDTFYVESVAATFSTAEFRCALGPRAHHPSFL
ncbi:hypothetical protein CC2G_012818 [Coprinopsis cinerea AmutBmut pab1-1]|nr:hypothetical protein CC2G_012818 [Coprinopsis cinerea AmutBmut pab1-1]